MNRDKENLSQWSPHSRQFKRAVLLRKYEAQRLELLQTAAEVNTYSDTSCLPNEILERIFSIYIDTYAEDLDIDLLVKASKPYGYFKITHICRHWRKVAHRHAALWTRLMVPQISPRYQEGDKLMLRLSKSFPLHVDIDGPRHRWKDHELLMNESHRIQTLNITFNRCYDRYPEGDYFTSDGAEELLARLVTETPILQSLTIQSSCLRSTETFNRSCAGPTSLKSFRAIGFELDVITPFCQPSITHLYLISNKHTHSRQTLVQVLSLLPQLKVLELVDAIGLTVEKDAVWTPSVHLNALNKLLIVDSFDRLAWFFTIFS
ncbi:hypothetical protein ABKN59_008019 [Abortiporus biennis]